MITLKDSIITLHDIARLVEREIGTGTISEDIRKCADNLHALINKPIKE